MADISEIIARLQVLRLNVMPPYTNDDDEGQRSEDEYLAFYNTHIDESITALDIYIKRIQALIDNRVSESAFNDYLAARRRVVECHPFCADELPPEGTSEYASLHHALRSAVMNSKQAVFSQGDVQILQEYRDLLISLQREAHPKDTV